MKTSGYIKLVAGFFHEVMLPGPMLAYGERDLAGWQNQLSEDLFFTNSVYKIDMYSATDLLCHKHKFVVFSINFAISFNCSFTKSSKALIRTTCTVMSIPIDGAAIPVWSCDWTDACFIARQWAFFGFLLPVFLTVCHRMLPFLAAMSSNPM
ncbi:hypothetical protein [Undibacterium pigrum]|uniref:hypothetical protein n=1 Tax=Undibacterium pigrum TaxID=401470 RepID=UPI0011B3D0DF|nr:hypothetical protein [Undibacterium pigrum]